MGASMQKEAILLSALVLLGVLMAGCAIISPKPPGEGTDTEVSDTNYNGAEAPDIIVPDINDSEGDFPLPA